MREIGHNLYGFTVAHAVRVDPQDNIWVADEGSNMIIKFSREGRVVMTMGRKSEDIPIPAGPPAGRGGIGGEMVGGEGQGGAGGRGTGTLAGAGAPTDIFNRPTDVPWDTASNIFVSGGYGNSRVAKFDRNGVLIKSWGSRGSAPRPVQYPTLHCHGRAGNVYVGDRGNRRIQVFDNNGELKTQYDNVGAP